MQAKQNLQRRMAKAGLDRVSYIEEAERSLAISLTWRDVCLDLLGEVDYKDWRYVHQHGEQIHGLVTLFTQAQAQATKDIVSYGRLDIAAEKARIDAEQAVMFVNAMKMVFDEAKLSRDQKALVSVALPRVLRELEGRKDEAA
jgi:hypothetical protein